MKVFLDTNIIIYYITNNPNFPEAVELVELAAEKGIELFTSTKAIYDVFFLSNRHYIKNEEETKEKVKEALRLFTLVDVDEDDVYLSFSHSMTDIEDALIDIIADKAGCNYIVTNDSDFWKHETIVSPIKMEDFISLLKTF